MLTNDCIGIIPGTHKVCGDDAEFCSESCYVRELLCDIVTSIDFSKPLTSMYKVQQITKKVEEDISHVEVPMLDYIPAFVNGKHWDHLHEICEAFNK